jgi:signal peptide peptidase SppA
VAVVKLHGVITPTPTPLARGTINVSTVESALTRAFAHDRLCAVALAINSPGGAPTQSALVAERVRELAAEKKVPVLAFCEDVAASGGYWLACAADEIYAHKTSLVGSIGVVTAGFGLAGLMERFGVERRVHTAGTRKVRLDPFQPENPDDVAWLKSLQGQLHDQFVDWVRERRDGKLVGADEDLFSGEVWTGVKALELGLIDGVGTLRSVVADRFPDAEISVAEPKRPLLARLGVASAAMSTQDRVLAAMEAVENRTVWSRFGL